VRELLERFEPRPIEPPEWEDVIARLERSDALEGPQPVEVGHTAPRRFRRARIRRSALVAALVTVAVAVVLTVTAPWRGGPTILERARAAIRSPSATEVLYMAYRDRTESCCRFLGQLDVRVWVYGSAPRHFRGVLPGVEPPFNEFGGTLGSRSVLTLFRYDSRTNTLDRLNLASHYSTGDFDPVAIVREAMAAGRAQVAGTALIGEKRVLRINLTARDRKGVLGRVVYYVDPKTYRPIQIEYPHVLELRFPFEPVFGNGIYKERIRFSAFKYLPATRTNIELADIRATHPDAKVSRRPVGRG
jgi:hypothetical protein